MEASQRFPEADEAGISFIEDVNVIPITVAVDKRGQLLALEFDVLPFKPVRSFVVSRVPSDAGRGEHAHWHCHQVLVCTSGSLSVQVTDGFASREFQLQEGSFGIHVPPLIWASQHSWSANTSLLVLASHPYDQDDYIRDFGAFAGIRAEK